MLSDDITTSSTVAVPASANTEQVTPEMVVAFNNIIPHGNKTLVQLTFDTTGHPVYNQINTLVVVESGRSSRRNDADAEEKERQRLVKHALEEFRDFGVLESVAPSVIYCKVIKGVASVCLLYKTPQEAAVGFHWIQRNVITFNPNIDLSSTRAVDRLLNKLGVEFMVSNSTSGIIIYLI
jgi:hypothetical protein